MFKTGLVSVSFRDKTPEEIIKKMSETGLQAIEWGGDIHVMPGNLQRAKEIAKLTVESGISVAAYGSYYRLCDPIDDFKKVLETASCIDAPVIRIWGGNKGSAELSETEFNELVDSAVKISQLAEKADKKISLECHNQTVTDDYRSSIKFIEAVNSQALTMYWQPNQFKSEQYNLDAAKALCKYTTNLHVFHWIGDKRYPLDMGTDIWKKYLEIFKKGNKDHALLLEFMHDGNISSLNETVKTLNLLLNRKGRISYVV